MTVNNQPLAALHTLSASNAVPRSREQERVVADRVRDVGEKHSDGERNKGEVSNQNPSQPLDLDVLWRHHELFQDAVNSEIKEQA